MFRRVRPAASLHAFFPEVLVFVRLANLRNSLDADA